MLASLILHAISALFSTIRDIFNVLEEGGILFVSNMVFKNAHHITPPNLSPDDEKSRKANITLRQKQILREEFDMVIAQIFADE